MMTSIQKKIMPAMCGLLLLNGGVHVDVAKADSISTTTTSAATTASTRSSGSSATVNNNPSTSPTTKQDEAKSLLQESGHHLAFFHIPTDDFWYPPFVLGRWDTSLTFKGAEFIPSIPLSTLAKDHNLPGFDKYSIFHLPMIGKDVKHAMFRFVSIDAHPREDHPFNIRQLISSNSPNTIIDNAAYSFQKATTWLSSPANHWTIQYHDETGTGVVKLTTKKRLIKTYAGTVETTEYFTQEHTRYPQGDAVTRTTKPKEISHSTFALQWKLSTPQSSRDEFVTISELSKANELIGSLNIFVYFEPTNDLYLKSPGEPAGVYSYEVNMNRLVDEEHSVRDEVQNVQYPFVFPQEQPIELDKYFGY